MSLDHRSHGGRTAELAARAGIPEGELLDFSANLDPSGPPPWLREAVLEAAERVGRYPDPDCRDLRAAAARRCGLPEERLVFADGADSLILALPSALGAAAVVAARPCYTGYLRAAEREGLPLVAAPLDPAEGFAQRGPGFEAGLRAALALAREARGRAGGGRARGGPGDSGGPVAAPPARPAAGGPPLLLFLGAPNNPAGGAPDPDFLRGLLAEEEGLFLALDESFAELASGYVPLLGRAGEPGWERLVVLRSMTKSWAVPGARLGFAAASPEIARALRGRLPSWPVSCFAEAIGLRAFADESRPAASAHGIAELSAELVAELAAFPGLRPLPGGANFLLVGLGPGLPGAAELAAGLLRRGIAVRTYSPEEGLDGRWLRVAVRRREENARLVAALRELLG